MIDPIGEIHEQSAPRPHLQHTISWTPTPSLARLMALAEQQWVSFLQFLEPCPTLHVINNPRPL